MSSEKVILPVPFFSQHWNIDAWQEYGFSDRKDAQFWEGASCGTLCVQMAIAYFIKKIIPIGTLIEQGLRLNGYTEPAGWKHDGLVALAQHNGLRASRQQLSVDDMVNAIQQNKLCIVSIRWGFEKRPLLQRLRLQKKSGGHLVLVVGFSQKDNHTDGVYIHHTSTDPEYNWETRFIPMKTFAQGFTGRGIIIKQGSTTHA